MQKILSYLTGAVALLIVGLSIIAALVYAVTHGMATLSNLANSTLSGIGIAIGGCLGSALILRFKAARRFVGHTVRDIADKTTERLA
jgi:uncharacterized membrane protein YdfJ with MMPL/SSD domain